MLSKLGFIGALICLLPAPRSPGQVSCSGCLGSTGMGSASGGLCGGSVGIEVVVTQGKCTWIGDPATGDVSCDQKTPCKPMVMREWMGLPPSSALEFCVQVGPDILCLQDPPDAGPTGSGSDSRESASLACGSSTTFTIESAGCGLTASAHVTFASCEESGEWR